MFKYFNEKQDPKIKGLNETLLQMLDNARSIAKIPFIITSGLRNSKENERVGGVIDSAHLKGLAVDIACCMSNDRYRIVSSLLVAGFKRIKIYKTHIHADIDKAKIQEVLMLEP